MSTIAESKVGMLRRRDALGLAGAAVLTGTRAYADTKLTIWTGYPEIQPVYQAVAAEYAKSHPGVSFDFFSTSLREAEQKARELGIGSGA